MNDQKVATTQTPIQIIDTEKALKTPNIYVQGWTIDYPHVYEKGSIHGKLLDYFSIKGYTEKTNPMYPTMKENVKALIDYAEKYKISIPQTNYCIKQSTRPEWNGMIEINLKNYDQPRVLDRDRTPLPQGSGKIYSGAKVAFLLNFYIMKNSQFQHWVSANIHVVQFMEHGEKLGPKRYNIETEIPILDPLPDDIGGDTVPDLSKQESSESDQESSSSDQKVDF